MLIENHYLYIVRFYANNLSTLHGYLSHNLQYNLLQFRTKTPLAKMHKAQSSEGKERKDDEKLRTIMSKHHLTLRQASGETVMTSIPLLNRR